MTTFPCFHDAHQRDRIALHFKRLPILNIQAHPGNLLSARIHYGRGERKKSRNNGSIGNQLGTAICLRHQSLKSDTERETIIERTTFLSGRRHARDPVTSACRVTSQLIKTGWTHICVFGRSNRMRSRPSVSMKTFRNRVHSVGLFRGGAFLASRSCVCARRACNAPDIVCTNRERERERAAPASLFIS